MKTLHLSLFLGACMLFNKAEAQSYTTLEHAVEPVIVALFPADDKIGVNSASNLAITFDVGIQKGVGDITIRRLTDNAILETIDVTNSSVTINESVVSINRTTDLPTGSYYVQIAAGAFKNLSGIEFSGISDDSTWNFTTNGCGQPPTNLGTGFVSNNFVVLEWDEMPGVQDYQLWISGLGLVTTTNPYYPLDNLPSGTAFSWAVRSKCNNSIFSDWSLDEFTTTGTNPCTITPENLNVDIDGNVVTLSWNESNSNDYQVWLSGVGIIQSTGGLSSYITQDLPSGSNFSWKVRSVCNESGKYVFSDWSNSGPEFTTSGTNPCGTPPVFLSEDIDDNTVTLRWEEKEDVNDYQVWISGIGIISSTNGLNEYIAVNLPSGTTFSWAVKSICNESADYILSDWSNSSEFITPGINPCELPPTGLFVDINEVSNKVTLRWEEKEDVNDYQVWIKGIGVISSTNGLNNYTTENLSRGNTFSWSVRSRCNISGSYIFSDWANGPIFSVPEASPLTEHIVSTNRLKVTPTLQSNLNDPEMPLAYFTENPALKVYPNPSLDEVTISIAGDETIFAIMVANLNGTVVKRIEGISSESKSLRLSEHGSGIYIIKVITNNGRQIIKKVFIR